MLSNGFAFFKETLVPVKTHTCMSKIYSHKVSKSLDQLADAFDEADGADLDFPFKKHLLHGEVFYYYAAMGRQRKKVQHRLMLKSSKCLMKRS
jgi:hypothetical protein